jgi:hypothetical protein
MAAQQAAQAINKMAQRVTQEADTCEDVPAYQSARSKACHASVSLLRGAARIRRALQSEKHSPATLAPQVREWALSTVRNGF